MFAVRRGSLHSDEECVFLFQFREYQVSGVLVRSGDGSGLWPGLDSCFEDAAGYADGHVHLFPPFHDVRFGVSADMTRALAAQRAQCSFWLCNLGPRLQISEIIQQICRHCQVCPS